MMKKIFFITIILVFLLNTYAQPYQPILQGEMIRWSFIDQHDCDGPLYSTEIIAFGDTILKGKYYKKMYLESTEIEIGDGNNTIWKNYEPCLYYPWENHFIRESEDVSKLFIYNSHLDEEYLVSNLDLQEGEIFQLQNLCQAIVDSVYYENGLKHIRWGMNYYPYSYCSKDKIYTYIESVSADMWFEYPDGCSGTYGLNCFQNQSTFYKNNRSMYYFDFSKLHCGGIFEFKPENINTFVKGMFNVFIEYSKIEIVFDNNEGSNISIYDMNGRLCYIKNNFFEKSLVVPTDFLSIGTYLLTIQSKKNNQVFSKKIVLY